MTAATVALAAALVLAAPAAASPFCDFTNHLIDSAPIPGKPIDGRAAGWTQCTATASAYLCYGPNGSPQTTRLAHLLSINADLAICTGIVGEETQDPVAGDNQRNFRMPRGTTISTFIEGGGIRMRIEFAHRLDPQPSFP